MSSAEGSGPRMQRGLAAYIAIARPDHWFKNAFMLLGVLLAVFHEQALFSFGTLGTIGVAVLATCLVASSNYVFNEILDAEKDKLHPDKKQRPIPSGQVHIPLAYLEWLCLAGLGFTIAATINAAFLFSALSLWVMGIIYNMRPLRTKEWPYLDVLSESVNNPIRLALGWFPLIPDRFPPVSLLVAYWMSGAFFMATKRFAECRTIKDPALLAGYRGSFRHYSADRLLLSMIFYAVIGAVFAGVFVVRYHLELILAAPLVAGFFAWYLKLGLLVPSPAEHPERLHREPGFVAYSILTTLVFVLLLYAKLPFLYDWFNVPPALGDPLWTLDQSRPR